MRRRTQLSAHRPPPCSRWRTHFVRLSYRASEYREASTDVDPALAASAASPVTPYLASATAAALTGLVRLSECLRTAGDLFSVNLPTCITFFIAAVPRPWFRRRAQSGDVRLRLITSELIFNASFTALRASIGLPDE